MAFRPTKRMWQVGAAVVVLVLVAVLVAVAFDGDDGDETTAGTDTTVSAPSTGASRTTATEPTATGPGQSSTTPPPSTPATTDCAAPAVDGEVLGSRDLNGDGVAELVVGVGSGAATDIVAVFRVDGCDAVRVAPDFPVGATVTRTSGLRVNADSVDVFSGTSTDGTTYAITWTSYRLGAGGFETIGSGSDTVAAGSDLLRVASSLTGL